MSQCLTSHHEVIDMLNTIIEEKDSYTAGHCKRVAFYSSKIAHMLSLSEDEQKTAYDVGLLHDIGKILTPEVILLKPRKLNKKEFHIIQRHVLDSEKIVQSISPFKHYLPLIRHHHEQFNGRGYPDQLQGDEIPFIARILSVADSFDAMTTNRIYKPRKTNAEAIDELYKCKGKQFDPIVVDAAIAFFETFDELAHINQLPQSFIQEERFAFFYKDKVTKAYTSEYLDYFLSLNNQGLLFSTCYLVELHHTHHYNTHYGWKSGNNLLKEMTARLKVLFQDAMIFRVFGDDFIVLCNTPAKLELDSIRQKLSIGFKPIDISIKYFSLRSTSTFRHWDDFESYLSKPNNKKISY